MKQSNKKSSPKTIWVVSGCMALLLLVGGAFMAKLVMSDVGPVRKMRISTVSLVPPPLPVVKEKVPEPEQQIKKDKMKEQIIDCGPDKTRPDNPDKPDEKPVGKQLGLDAEGTAGSDAFGLIGNKGGAGLIGSGDGGGSAFGRYGRVIEDDLNRKVKKRLEASGGIPKGSLKLLAQIDVDPQGKIIRFRIFSSSGDPRLDSAVRDTLKHDGVISQAPPEGMPRGVNIRISSQG
ncbi:MAG TPA: TonB family protein [Syntrophobacteraceae bacterium]|nr:TonB family protein [Syntrophobacteraceae bacterium]